MGKQNKDNVKAVLESLVIISTILALVIVAIIFVQDARASEKPLNSFYQAEAITSRVDPQKPVEYVTEGGKMYCYKYGKLYSGWTFDINGYPERYFYNGVAVSGWVPAEIEGKLRYFDKKTFICMKGWINTNGKYRYFAKTTGIMAIGWVKNSNGQHRYFNKTNGIMVTGWVKDSKNNYRYFDKNSGIMFVGWVKTNKGTYYFNPKTGIAYRRELAEIDGKIYYFNEKGLLEE